MLVNVFTCRFCHWYPVVCSDNPNQATLAWLLKNTFNIDLKVKRSNPSHRTIIAAPQASWRCWIEGFWLENNLYFLTQFCGIYGYNPDMDHNRSWSVDPVLHFAPWAVVRNSLPLNQEWDTLSASSQQNVKAVLHTCGNMALEAWQL